jgi:N-acetylglucosamine kinase-like BadF-type ATPase
METRDVVVGVDAGGTWLRVRVESLDGEPLDYVRIPAGRTADGVDLRHIAGELLWRLTRAHRVFAGAGTNSTGLADAWADAGIGAPFATMSEAVLACDPDHGESLVLIAGTGSAAATVIGSHEELVTGAQGISYDKGAGVWLGDQLVRANHSMREHGSSDYGWSEAIHDLRLVPDPDLGPSSWRATLAPVVTGLAAAGDDAAEGICLNAAAHLVELLDGHDTSLPLITVGSLVDPSCWMEQHIAERLSEIGIDVWTHREDLTGPALAWAHRLVP